MASATGKRRKYVRPMVEVLNEEEMLARFQVSTGSISWWL